MDAAPETHRRFQFSQRTLLVAATGAIVLAVVVYRFAPTGGPAGGYPIAIAEEASFEDGGLILRSPMVLSDEYLSKPAALAPDELKGKVLISFRDKQLAFYVRTDISMALSVPFVTPSGNVRFAERAFPMRLTETDYFLVAYAADGVPRRLATKAIDRIDLRAE